MKNNEEALKLFSEMYLPEETDLIAYLEENGLKIGTMRSHYGKMDGIQDGISKILGTNAFAPMMMVDEVLDDDDNLQKRIFLSLHPQGKFNHLMTGSISFNKRDKKRIDVTDMSREEILDRVSELLSMSNEEIMNAFAIEYPYTPWYKFALILDDVVTGYCMKNEQEETQFKYYPEMIYRSFGNGTSIQITDTDIKIGDEYIKYRMLDDKQSDISEMRVEILDSKINSELGQALLGILQERFIDRNFGPQTLQTDILETLAEHGRDGLRRDAMVHTINEATIENDKKPIVKGE